MAFKIGHKGYWLGKTRSRETIEKMRKARLKQEHRRKPNLWIEKECSNCGKLFEIYKRHTKKGRGQYCSRECFAKAMKGQIRKRQRSFKICQQCNNLFEIRPCEKEQKFCSRKCSDNSKIGKKRLPFTKDHKRKIGKANKGNGRWGENSNHWNGGITHLYYIFRLLDEYKEWRMNCLKRDWFKCQICDSKEKLEVHHKKSFRKLVEEFLKEYNQFSPIEDRETLTRLTIKWQPFWDINNGITYCEKCHKSLRRVRC